MFSDIFIIDNLIVTTLIIIVVLYLGSELPSRGHFLFHGGAPIFCVTAVVAAWISTVLGWLEYAIFVDFAELILSVVVIADISWRLVAAMNTVSD